MFPAPQPVAPQQPYVPQYLRPVAPAAAFGSAAHMVAAGQASHYQGFTPSGAGVMTGQAPVHTQSGLQGNPLFSQAAVSGFGASPSTLAPPPGLPAPAAAQPLGLGTPTSSISTPPVTLAPPSSYAHSVLSTDTLMAFDQGLGSVFGDDGPG